MGSVQAQLDYNGDPRWNLPNNYYYKQFPVDENTTLTISTTHGCGCGCGWDVPVAVDVSLRLLTVALLIQFIVFIDTTPYIQMYYAEPENEQMQKQLAKVRWEARIPLLLFASSRLFLYLYLYRRLPSCLSDTHVFQDQQAWLERTFEEVSKNSTWIYVAGHHPIISQDQYQPDGTAWQ
jgi:hypothetical protein